jgi:hypothetical protein
MQSPFSPLASPPAADASVVWRPNWYVTRLHAVRGPGSFGLCGSDTFNPDELRGEWQERRLAKEVPQCNNCLRLLAK